MTNTLIQKIKELENNLEYTPEDDCFGRGWDHAKKMIIELIEEENDGLEQPKKNVEVVNRMNSEIRGVSEMNKTLTEKIEEIVGHDTNCVTNASEVCDEFSIAPCSCGTNAMIKDLLTLFQEEMEEAKKEGARKMIGNVMNLLPSSPDFYIKFMELYSETVLSSKPISTDK